ncbi:MAG TPA: inositol monophosphatase family protein [Coriobacteriia bacterium]|nr:inositol monophosphatase family protein [Coriobacteriia bacterium]
MHDALQTARAAAQAAGTLVRARAGAVGAVSTKSTAIDLVTATDIASGVEAVKVIMHRDPGSTFVVEEDEVYDLARAPRGDLESGRVWVIDPIDGTTSFLHGYPCYSVSIALLQDGEPLVGVVYNAALDEMNWASAGEGAYRDGNRLTTKLTDSLSRAVLVTGFPYDRTDPLERQLLALSAFLRHPVQDIRRDGSAAIDCCHVAAGRCDGYWEYGLHVWDVAAGVLICREAGAKVTDIDGQPWSARSTSICTANPALHSAMLDLIGAATADF